MDGKACQARSVSVVYRLRCALQAGNKSALTYRCDIGIPGYTGYIPQTAALPLQVKGSTKYIGEAAAEHAPHFVLMLLLDISVIHLAFPLQGGPSMAHAWMCLRLTLQICMQKAGNYSIEKVPACCLIRRSAKQGLSLSKLTTSKFPQW